MRAARVVLTITITIALANIPSHAQPQPPPETDERALAPYPRALVQRKLLQPDGTVEGSALVGMDVVGNDSTDQVATLHTRGRYSLGVAELAAGISLQLYNNVRPTATRDDDVLQTVSASARYLIATDFGLGAEVAISDPTSDNSRYAPRLVLAKKLRINPAAAIELVLAQGLDRATLGAGSDATRATILAISGQIRAQAQVTPAIALEGRASLGYFDALADPEPLMPLATEYFAQDYGLRVVGGVTPYVDVVGGFDVIASGGTTTRVLSVGVTVRRVP